ncbi:MAG TPA: LuxR C-terminal-related transcriptional regulator [Gammaproteobacteria bacterium]|nr:LuxR C-terminal-related transcriptional regulator [Gammaproteobacteria bacterium]
MMTYNIGNHPSLRYTREVYDICRPLQVLNITYFAHVNIDKNGQFSALSNNPQFIEHYLKNKYYNCDIHMAKNHKSNSYILWDNIELTGESLKLHLESFAFGVQHTFTIIEASNGECNYYHFANNQTSSSINQIYLNNIDLLRLFISEFNKAIKQSSLLSQAYDLKFLLDTNATGYTMRDNESLDHNVKRLQFYKELKKKFHNSIQSVILSQQQMRCLNFLNKGMTSKEIAKKLNISPRTVEQHLRMARESIGCRNSKELIVRCREMMICQSIDT